MVTTTKRFWPYINSSSYWRSKIDEKKRRISTERVCLMHFAEEARPHRLKQGLQYPQLACDSLSRTRKIVTERAASSSLLSNHRSQGRTGNSSTGIGEEGRLQGLFCLVFQCALEGFIIHVRNRSWWRDLEIARQINRLEKSNLKHGARERKQHLAAPSDCPVISISFIP